MISNLTKELWDKKVIELGGSILQSWNWGVLNESLGHKIHRMSDESFINLAIEIELPFGKKHLYSPRGPLGDEQRALADLKRLGTDENLIFARIEPQHAVDLPRAIKDVQPINNWFLNLEKTEEELLMGMKPKTRYNINLAQRKGVTVRVGEQADLITLYQLFLETATRNQIRLHPQNYYLQMWEQLQGAVKIVLAEYQGKPLAGMLLSIFGDAAVYMHGGTSMQLKDAMAPYLLHWEAIRLAKQSGCKDYDFGGIAPSGEAIHPWAGITRFKKGFGGYEVTYPGAFDLIYSPIWYTIYKQGRKLTKLVPK
jgi:peptidoglycan pentaglycine glycine transferase (the first glycine)